MATPQTQSSLNPGEMACPDPSAHVHQAHEKYLQDQASTAALYVTNPAASKSSTMKSDSGLSAASAAASLKYAKPQDLPSYPVSGSVSLSSAGAAASLAHANQKPVETWTPETSSNAGKAALLVKDNKPPATWEPQSTSAGSKAARLAHRNNMKKVADEATIRSESDAASAAALRSPPRRSAQTLERSEGATNDNGSSAAGAAMRPKSQSPPTGVESRAEQQRKALLAATGAFSTTTRKRSESTPNPVPSFPDAQNSGRNALNAATISHKSSVRSPQAHPAPAITKTAASNPALDAARIQNIGSNVSKDFWGDSPPLRFEVEEKKHKDALRGASISMAKNLYDIQAKINEDQASGLSRSKTVGHAAATSVRGRPESTSSKDIKEEALRYLHVQDAAQKLAAERLSKIMPDQDAAFRQYYGYGSPTRRSRLSRFSHRRASSEGSMGGVDSDDEERSKHIRRQMNKFNAQVALIDEKKRTKDRQSLMAAAERLVHAQMHTMDEKVFNETGKVPPALMEEWEQKAQARAAEDSEARLQHHGKIHVGGGKYITQEEIDAVATSRIQPTLDEITDQAEKQRARDEEIRLDQDEKKRQEKIDRDRDAELKAEQKKQKELEKQEEKQKRDEEKTQQKLDKDQKKAEKARKAEEKRQQKEEKRKSKESRKSYINHENTIATQDTDENGVARTRTEYSVGVSAEQPADPNSPTSPNRLSRFIGKFKRPSKPAEAEDGEGAGLSSPSSSSLSSSGDEAQAEGGRGRSESHVSAGRSEETKLEILTPAPAFASSENKESSPARAGKFHEEL